MNLNIQPNPAICAGKPGGVNSVVADHAVGFLAAGASIVSDGLTIIHALAQSEQVDVFHCHGLYPIGNNLFDASYSRANNIVLQNALKARLTICISEFSANILRHKLHIDPHVTRNGIWTKDYHPAGSPTGPILFPKTALDANARPDAVLWLKDNSPFDLLSIARIDGIRSTGQLNRTAFLKTLSDCSIYLGVTKENNSMATMEAMISGVPVVGYSYGFNAEWLTDGVGCILVPPGDLLALRDAIATVKGDWARYSREARNYAEIFDWQPVINELLGLYEAVGKETSSRSVSIIIPLHNYEQWISEAITSALNQTVRCEIIVVDDLSTDHSAQIAESFTDRGVKVMRNTVNLGVAETRNKGIQAASGEFIVCLDADDRLLPQFIEKHLAAFRSEADAITYAPIDIIDERGERKNQRLFRPPANPNFQAMGRNQIPSCCMFRKTFWRRAGGYDKRYTPAEDAHLWLKIFSIGGIPVAASRDSLMEYRSHDNSLSAPGFPNWWIDAAPSYSEPIPERDSHITIVLDKTDGAKETLWSLENQKYQNWSCLLQEPNNLKATFPWINHSTHRRENVINIPSGTVLPPNFLQEYVSQTAPWI